MANTKISALTSATTPLAGTETLPVVQSSATTKVTVADLTAGRAVSALSYTSTTGATFATTSGSVGIGTTLVPDKLSILGNSTGFIGVRCTNNNATGADKYVGMFAGGTSTGITTWNNSGVIESAVGTNLVLSGYNGTTLFQTGTSRTTKASIDNTGNLNITLSNVVFSTAAKGVDFSANTPAAGKTSTLLNWYEEGTWTPNQGAGLTLVGAFSSTGKYTRVGRNVTVSGTVTGATSVAVTAAGVVTSNLPFTVGTAGHGNATNAAVTASATVICTSTSVTSAAAIAATGTITFSATYFV
jgi:hypothetical protein